jgi:hypothetical protein
MRRRRIQVRFGIRSGLVAAAMPALIRDIVSVLPIDLAKMS